MITQIKKGKGCTLKVSLMIPGTNTIADLRNCSEISARLKFPEGTISQVACKYDELTNKVIIPISSDNLNIPGIYGVSINAKKGSMVMSSLMVNIIEVSEDVANIVSNVFVKFDVFTAETTPNADISGASPYIGVTNTWYVYNDELKAFVDSGIKVDYSADENIRVESEKRRAESENGRTDSETSRRSDETKRLNAETERTTSEESRATAERSRTENESKRVQSESTRADNEQKRQESETARVEVEEQRVTEESKRVSNESTRATQEKKRETAESNRVTAETNRSEAESARVTEEGKRVTAENNRTSKESNRVTAENARNTNETKRQEDTETAIRNAETATDKANKAAESVDQSINDALVPVNEKIAHIETKVTRKAWGVKDGFEMGISPEVKTISLYINTVTPNTNGDTRISTYSNPHVAYYNMIRVDTNVLTIRGVDGSTTLQTATHGKPNHIVFTDFINNTYSVYVNAVYLGKVNGVIDLIKQITVSPNIQSDIVSVNTFNYAFTQVDVDRVYNQGRVFDVNLGDEWRRSVEVQTKPVQNLGKDLVPNGNGEFIIAAGDIQVGWWYKTPYFRNTVVSVSYSYKLEGVDSIEFDSNFNNIKGVRIRLTKQSDFKQVAYTSYTGDSFDIIRFIYGNIPNGATLTIKDVVVKSANLLDEFTPDSLTLKKWLNIGTNTTNIAFTNPVFSYQKPIPEWQWTTQGSTYPTPVAMGQKLYILNNDGTRTIKESPCKPNTRHWSNNQDWQ